jgi:uncharacterized protein
MLPRILFGGMCLTLVLSAAPIVDSSLADAVMNGNRGAVKTLLNQKVDVNAAQGDGSTALHWAVMNDDLETAQLLIKAGASVDAKSRMGAITALYLAAQHGSAPMIDLLLKAGASANEANDTGTTVLMLAAGSGSVDAIKILLDHGADINAKEKTWGETPLMFAAAMNRADAIKLLIARGADSKATSNVVGLGKYKDVIKAEVNDVDAKMQNQLRSKAPDFMGGMTPLHFAARDGQMAAIQALVESGANVNELSAADQTSVLTESIYNGHYDIAKYLLDHEADPKPINRDGLGALYATIDMQWANRTWYPPADVGQQKTSYLDLMAEMLDKGADPNVRIKKKLWFRRFHDDWVEAAGATPFWRAAEANDLAAMKLLVAHGADPNVATQNNDTALIVAAGYGFEDQLSAIVPDARFDVVKYLVNELNADVSAQDIWRYTALHGAAYVGNNDMILFLLAHGADIGVRSKGFVESEGQTVFEAPGESGDTVADMANGPREHGLQHPDTLALLERLGSQNSHNCRSSTCVLVTNAGGFGDLNKKAANAQKPDEQKPTQPAK